MRCLRCGRENDNQQEFCKACLESMEKYPISPNTLIQLPQRRTGEMTKRQSGKKRAASAEEQLEQLKKLMRWMVLGLILLVTMLCVATAMLVKEYQKPETQPVPLGRNYTVTPDQAD